ncbi:Hypothetical predicted protein [Olea europaea subsp. europaea]|uniref:Uncharacterized protein n=1 Tax=Olea europaea subsp. europaea TaxID=158383 RepID=A0A8S0U4L3_OLEEU|nr:Hypothetical predicted protein [Olea europaea subsp. europaea]
MDCEVEPGGEASSGEHGKDADRGLAQGSTDTVRLSNLLTGNMRLRFFSPDLGALIRWRWKAMGDWVCAGKEAGMLLLKGNCVK